MGEDAGAAENLMGMVGGSKVSGAFWAFRLVGEKNTKSRESIDVVMGNFIA
jgi:hypothetical protein